jgi:hypothetical protein
MDDLIVLVLTIIFIIAGVIGQMKKRQVPPEPVGENNSRMHDFWESVEDEEEEPKRFTTLKQPVKEAAPEDRFHTRGNIMKRNFVRHILPNEPVKPLEDASETKRFPLKQAIIYSEILNTKYF